MTETKTSIPELEKKYCVDIMVTTRDRHSEISLLLQSLRSQTFKNWNLIILDDASGAPLRNCEFFGKIIDRIKLEGHAVFVFRNSGSTGVCAARNILIREQLNMMRGNVCFRCDDDVLLEPDYVEKLLLVLEEGYDIATGVVPDSNVPPVVRENKFIHPMISPIEIDEKTGVIRVGDDMGMCYLDEEILPTHHFRTNALYKKEVHEKITYQPNLSQVGFREESFFSLHAILNGYTIGCHTGAVAYHLRSQSGGCRWKDYNTHVQSDNQIFVDWLKQKIEKKGNFLEAYKKKVTKK